jgi:hypothetical protein
MQKALTQLNSTQLAATLGRTEHSEEVERVMGGDGQALEELGGPWLV